MKSAAASRSAYARLLFLVAALLLAPAHARAQSGDGGLRGFVTDSVSSANGIAGARVELRELYVWYDAKKQPQTYNTETDSTGNYSFPRVRMGEYALRVTAEGYEPSETTFLITSDMEAVFGTLLKKSAARADKRLLVDAVEILGNRRLSDDEIFSRISTRPGSVFDEQKVLRDLQKLLSLHVFDTTQTRVTTKDGAQGGVVITFMVVELPMLDAVKFEGPKVVAEADVLRALAERGIRLRAGEVFDPSQLNRAEQIVSQLLVERGLAGVSVKVQIVAATATSASVEFRFKEQRY